MKLIQHGLVKPGSGYKQYKIILASILRFEFHAYYHGAGFRFLPWLFLYKLNETYDDSIKVFKPGFQLEIDTGFGGVTILFNYQT